MATQIQLKVILTGSRIATRVLWSKEKTKTESKEMYKKSVLHVQSCFFAN